MRICILSQEPRAYSTKRLVEVATKRKHKVEVIDTLKCYIDITSNDPSIYLGKEKLKPFDAVIPRIGHQITFYGTAVLRQFEVSGTYPLNQSIAITRSRDKLRAHQLLALKGVGIPNTSFAHSTEDSSKLIEIVGGAPLVIKLLEGSQGRGVILAETKKAAESVIDAFNELNAFFLAQEYIEEAEASDIRCFVIGDKVVASMMRKAKKGDFRSNIHRGAKALPVKITPEERKTAVQAARVMGLNVAGVDIVRSARGPLVLEVNSSPGLQGIEEVSKTDVADLIIQYIENNARFKKVKERGS